MRKPIEWHTMFLNMAFATSERSKDDSTQCGAILVDEKNSVISTGFNGPPPQIDDTKVPWNQRPQKYAYLIHAEENALWRGVAARGLFGLQGSTLYCTNAPCTECLARMMMLGIKKVVIPSCHKPYPMSKYQVEPKDLIEAQKFPKIEIEEVTYSPLIPAKYIGELLPRDSED